MDIPKLTYISETRTLTQEVETKAAKTKLLRTVAGYTLKELRNTVIKKQRHIRIFNLNNIK
jgi:hypothetical protein